MSSRKFVPGILFLAVVFSASLVLGQASQTSQSHSAVQAPVLNSSHWGLYGGDVNRMDLDISVRDLFIHPKGWGYKTFGDKKTKQAFWDGVRDCRQKGKYQLVILGLKGNYEERVAQLDRMLSQDDGCKVYYSDLVGVALGHEVTTGADRLENRLYDYIKSRWPALQVYKFYSGPIKPYSALGAGHPEKCDGYLYDIYQGDKDGFRRTVQKFVITGKPVVILIWATQPGFDGFYKNDLIAGMADMSKQDGVARNAPNSEVEKYFRHASATLQEFGLPSILFGVSDKGSINHWYWGKMPPNLVYIREKLAFPLRDIVRARKNTGPEESADYSIGKGVEVLGEGGNTVFDYGLQQKLYRKGMKHTPRRQLPSPYVDHFVPDDLYVGLRTIDHATVRGFTKLVQTDSRKGVLVTSDLSGKEGQVEIIYRFFTREGTMTGIGCILTCKAQPELGGEVSLAISRDGKEWKHERRTKGGAKEHLIVSGARKVTRVSEFYVRIRMKYKVSSVDNPSTMIDRLVVHASRKIRK